MICLIYFEKTYCLTPFGDSFCLHFELRNTQHLFNFFEPSQILLSKFPNVSPRSAEASDPSLPGTVAVNISCKQLSENKNRIFKVLSCLAIVTFSELILYPFRYSNVPEGPDRDGKLQLIQEAGQMGSTEI